MPSSKRTLRVRAVRDSRYARGASAWCRASGVSPTHLITRTVEGRLAAPMQQVRREPAVVVASIRALAQRWIEQCAATARVARAERGRFALAVPGGSVAELFLPELAKSDMDWGRMHLFFCDERCVPPDHPNSNYGYVERLMLEPLGDRAPHVYRMPGEDPDAERAARDYASTLRFVLGSPPVLDMALLGVGEDGHVASLFPGHASLAEMDQYAIAEEHAPKLPARRLTLSLGVLAAAREVVVGAFGASKATAVASALHDPSSELPLALLLRHTNRATVMVDEDAARGLGR